MASYTPRGCYVQKRSHQTAYTGIACPDKKVNNGWTNGCLADSICILKDWQGSQDGHCKRGDSCPYSHNTFEDWLHPTRYHTQLCQTGAQCSRPICFFAHRSAELREPTWETSLPQDVLCTARLAVSAEVALGPTISDRFCPLSNEKWWHFARSSAQAGTVGVTADDQPQRNAFDEGRRSDDINRASQL
ncbi:TPA: hypothetical protein ACH3X1_001141 [Trebouxia sp. C0004]